MTHPKQNNQSVRSPEATIAIQNMLSLLALRMTSRRKCE